MNTKDFERLLAACGDVASMFPDGVAFIGGIAVYLHAVNLPSTSAFAEFTNDADCYIAFADMGDLRDIEEVTPNRGLSKHQMIKEGFEFDIYTERQASLRVPYDSVIAASTVVGGIRLTCLEHLLVLKLEAYKDRKASAKGDKDAKDLLRIGAVAVRSGKAFDPSRVVPFLDDEHLGLLRDIRRGSLPLALAQGNAVEARNLRNDFGKLIGWLSDQPDAAPPPPPPGG